MPAHSSLTGADLHESKGVDTAGANSIFIADGAGSGSFGYLGPLNFDGAQIKNLNMVILTVKISDLANASTVTIPIPNTCYLLNATSCITGAISGGNSVLTFSRAGSATIGTITIDASGSGEGILDAITTPVNNLFTGPSWLKIASDGGPTGGTSDAWLYIYLGLA